MKVELFYCPLTDDTVYVPIQMDNRSLIPFKGKYSPYPEDSKRLELNCPSKVENLIFPINLTEPINSEDFTDIIDNSLKFCETSNFFPNLKNVFILYTTATVDETVIKSKYNIKKHFILYYVFRSYLTKELSNYKNFSDWNNSNKKCLHLVGEIFKENRFPVFFEFYKNNTLNLLNYSLYYNYSLNYQNFETYFDRNRCKWLCDYMSQAHNINKIEFLELYKKLENTLDEDDFFTVREDNWLNISAFIFPKEWKDCSLVLHGESYFSLYRQSNNLKRFLFYTEKTWKPICTKKPFIACSNADWVNRGLTELGFKNFLEYTDHPEFIESDINEHQNTKNVATITHSRVVSFLKNMEKYKEKINADIEYNYNLWNDLAQQSWDDFYNTFPMLQTVDKKQLISEFIHKPYILP